MSIMVNVLYLMIKIKDPLGHKTWTVVCELQQNDAALIALKKFKSRQEEVISRLEQKNEPFLKIVAASILLFLDGSQPQCLNICRMSSQVTIRHTC